MAVFFEINEARKVLGLEEAASEAEIESAYQRLALKWHPDCCKAGDRPEAERQMKDINWAYTLLREYCSRSECKYLFTERAVARAYPREAYAMRWAEFMADDSHV